MEDIQAEDVEQVESTQLNFGQADDTQQASEDGQVADNIINWQEDKRYADHWGEDPNKMYESLKYLEKKQGDYDGQINDYKSQVEDLGRYKSDYEVLEKLMDAPGVGDDIMGVLERYQNGQTQQNQQQNYQPNPDNQLQNQLRELMDWKNNLSARADQLVLQEQQEQQMGQINEYAKKYNIQYNPDDFLKYANENNVPMESWVHHFKSHAADVAMQNARNQAAENAYKSKLSTPSSSSSGSKGNPVINERNIDDALSRILG
jgi:vacuolar-type H+-ATPase subunit I/STV1|tara:strand:+ start:1246 stop:2028 length:783 start_codon:yes stop_codon:yes gene_type:complete